MSSHLNPHTNMVLITDGIHFWVQTQSDPVSSKGFVVKGGGGVDLGGWACGKNGMSRNGMDGIYDHGRARGGSCDAGNGVVIPFRMQSFVSRIYLNSHVTRSRFYMLVKKYMSL